MMQSNCYGSYLTDTNDDKCSSIITCLLTAPKKLGACIRELENESMWKQAERDAHKASPKMICYLLSKFGFYGIEEYDKAGKKYSLPVEFAKWEKEVVDTFEPHVKEAIRKNTPLLNYLSALVSILRNDASILNKHTPQTAQRTVTNDLSVKTGRGVWHIPWGGNIKPIGITELVENHIVNTQQISSSQSPLTVLGGIIPLAHSPQIAVGWQHGGQRGGQRGGQHGGLWSPEQANGCIDKAILYQYMVDQLQTIGLVVDSEINDEMANAIEGHKHLGKQIDEMIAGLLWLEETLKANGIDASIIALNYDPNSPPPVLKREDVRTTQDLIRFAQRVYYMLRNNIKNGFHIEREYAKSFWSTLRGKLPSLSANQVASNPAQKFDLITGQPWVEQE